MSTAFTKRLRFWTSCFRGIGEQVIVALWALVQLLTFIRDEFFPKYSHPLVSILPQWSWQTWVITWLAILLAIVLEGAYKNAGKACRDYETLKHRLDQVQTPRLTVEYRDQDTRYRVPEQGREMVYISVHNWTSQTINNIKVMCNGAIPIKAGRVTLMRPSGTGEAPIILSPGESRFIRFAVLVPGREVQLALGSTEPMPRAITGSEFLIKVLATANDMPATRGKMRIQEQGETYLISYEPDVP